MEKEISQIKKMVDASYAKGKLKEFSEDMIVCIIDICNLEEQQVVETKPELKEAMVMLDTLAG